jgi:NTP pyrophosphatase (non-canonical NTP hydrolase)
MKMNEYQDFTMATALYPGAGEGTVAAVAYCGLGLGEAGEVQGKIKKIIRDDNSEISDEKKEQIAAELGDVLWYVARLAAEIGYPLANIAEANIAKLLDRRARGVVTGSGDNR